jgi:hypothetical protein
LEKSIPKKLRAWREPGVRFVVIRDNDGGDCHKLKDRLTKLCKECGRAETEVRIVCQELEAWYLGDLEALARAYKTGALSRIEDKSRYRDPDSVTCPSAEIARLVPEFQKVSGARLIARCLSRHENKSRSFHVLINRIERIAVEMQRNSDEGNED